MSEGEVPSVPPAPSRQPLGIARSIALCLVFYVVFVAAMIPAEIFRRLNENSLDYFSLMVIPQIVAWLVTIRLGFQWSGAAFSEACSIRPFPLRIVPPLVLASYGATILLLEVVGWIPMPDVIQQDWVEKTQHSSWLELLLPVVVVAPIAEELFFRGLVLQGYLRRYSVTKAVWASATMFAVFHLNPWQGVVVLPLGVAFALLAIRTGSVLPSMLSHAVVNFSANFLLQPLASVLGYSAADLKAANHFPPEMLAIGGVLAIGGCVVIWRQLRFYELPQLARPDLPPPVATEMPIAEPPAHSAS